MGGGTSEHRLFGSEVGGGTSEVGVGCFFRNKIWFDEIGFVFGLF